MFDAGLADPLVQQGHVFVEVGQRDHVRVDLPGHVGGDGLDRCEVAAVGRNEDDVIEPVVRE